MPSQQQSREAGFSRARCADDGDMRAGGDGQVDIAEDLMARGDNANVVESDRDWRGERCVRYRVGRSLGRSAVLDRARAARAAEA